MISVYHIDSFKDSISSYFEVENLTIDMSKYTKVAHVESDSLDKAYELTNNISSSWTENENVRSLKGSRVRSTSVGDVMELNGVFYIVASIGFSKINITGEAK